MTQSTPRVAIRALGFWMTTALVVGNIIGMGVFMMPAALAPFGLNAILGWLVTVTGAGFLAVVFAGLARSFPQDDGPYAYTQRAFGVGTAFIVMWCYWVATWITNATLAIGVVGYLTILVPVLGAESWYPPATALAFLWFFVALNLRGVRTAGWVQLATTILKLLPMIVVILLGLWHLLDEPAAYAQHVPPNPFSLREVMAASTIALFAMLGIECATIPACRVRDPERTIPRATIAGVIVTALIYIAISLIPMFLIPQAELATSNAPFADLLSRFIGAGSGELIALFVVISGLGALNGWTLVVGEVTQSLARHGNFPRVLARENRFRAPTLSFVLTGAVASIMLLMNYNASLVNVFTFMSVVVTAANLPLFVVCALAVLALQRRGEMPRAGRRGAMLLTAGVLGCAYCIWAFLGVGWKPLAWALVLCGAGVPVYLWSSYQLRRAQSLSSGA
jgi:basic amino acid/polyamine antiporter, APA family